MTRILYALCGANPQVLFSPHVFKIFMALHHKKLGFEMAPTPFTAIGKIESGFSATLPVLNDNGTLVRDSYDIALYLEDAYPEAPSLFAGDGGRTTTRAIEGFSQMVIQPALLKIIVMDIHNRLAPADQVYFRQSREKRFGMSLEAYAAKAEAELAGFGARLEPIRHVLKSQNFLGGDRPLFADYIVMGAFFWAGAVSPRMLLAAGDLVQDWLARCHDLHGGVARRLSLGVV